jgi:hypothetical protein
VRVTDGVLLGDAVGSCVCDGRGVTLGVKLGVSVTDGVLVGDDRMVVGARVDVGVCVAVWLEVDVGMTDGISTQRTASAPTKLSALLLVTRLPDVPAEKLYIPRLDHHAEPVDGPLKFTLIDDVPPA